MHVIFQVKPGSVQQLRKALTDLDVDIKPLFPGTKDPNMESHYFTTVNDSHLAEEVSKRALASGAVEAAYAKPLDAAP
jgi:hypothetical protein